ncbi:MAG: AAA family ATPase [Phycisphaeraceae bacterium]|nr:AAA family ATPase [Phycisphaeraceae bacterium]
MTTTEHRGRPDPVSPDRLRWRCPREWLPFETTASVEPAQSILGQSDAAEALRFGLATTAPGHHVFVRGLAGTGRVTLVRQMMERIRPQGRHTHDHCYVRNFAHPEQPRLITLPPGCAAKLAAHMEEFAQYLREGIPKAMDSDQFKAERSALDASVEARLKQITQPFESDIATAGLTMVTMDVGPMKVTALAAMIDGNPVPPEALDSLVVAGRLDKAGAEALRQRIDDLTQRMAQINGQLEELRREHAEKGRKLVARQIGSAVEPMLEDIRRQCEEEEISRFLTAVREDITTHRVHAILKGVDISRLYLVNPIVEQPADGACPIVLESTPSVANLFGSIQLAWSKSGASRSDHMMIRPGALLRADGGFLLIEAREVLAEPNAWRMLIRALRTGQIDFPSHEAMTPWGVDGLDPESVPLNTKVILVGDAEIFYLLDEHDDDFAHLFKVLADFDSAVPRSKESVELYARVIAKTAWDESLPPFGQDAVAALVEHGARIAGAAGMLTTRLGRIMDISRESAFVAGEKQEQVTSGEHVREAIRRTKRRGDLPARNFREYLANGTIQVQITGATVGQINGLAVVHAGPLVYGFPQRITASVSPGGAGVINIEREANLSGSIHTKGFYILGGLLRELIKPEHPFAFDAAIAFEQSYGGIDGDSASGAEMCCLLSALTGIPIRQDFSMTGAIDQKGHVMAIGAVNEKIEGFYDTCAAAGPTGAQGVVIPASNVGDLALRPDVVEACAEGRFRVVAVKNIGEAIETLFDSGDPANPATFCGVIDAARERIKSFWQTAARARGDGFKSDATERES